MAESLADKLRMDHLLEASTEDLKTSVLKSVGSQEAAEPEKADPRDQEVYTFQFDWTDARGKRWQGEFTNKILDFSEQQAVAILKSKFNGGQPIESMDPTILALNGTVAHMTFSLKSCPDWAKDLRKIKDLSLIAELGKEVDSHESYYFRLNQAEA